jgi:hypothetical protein
MIIMTANRQLAEALGLSEEAINEIDRIHPLIDKFTRAWVEEPFSQGRKDEIHSLEYLLQRLWGFSEDCGYHRYADEYEFKCQWVGKKYRCTNTGEEFTIPYEVKERDCYFFGDGAMIDVGRLHCYARFSGVEPV